MARPGRTRHGRNATRVRGGKERPRATRGARVGRDSTRRRTRQVPELSWATRALTRRVGRSRTLPGVLGKGEDGRSCSAVTPFLRRVGRQVADSWQIMGATRRTEREARRVHVRKAGDAIVQPRLRNEAGTRCRSKQRWRAQVDAVKSGGTRAGKPHGHDTCCTPAAGRFLGQPQACCRRVAAFGPPGRLRFDYSHFEGAEPGAAAQRSRTT